jgi:hypothetical protein
VRNRENLKQYLMLARCYEQMGRKLIALGHYNQDKKNTGSPTQATKDEMGTVAEAYMAIKSDFSNMWLAEDKPNSTFDQFVGMFGNTITPYYTLSGKSRPYVNTFDHPTDLAGSMIRFGMVGELENGELKLTYNSGAEGEPGGSIWGFNPQLLFVPFGFAGDNYKEFACKVTVTGAPVAEFPMLLTSYVTDAAYNSQHGPVMLHNGTQIVRFNVDQTRVSGTWKGFFSHIMLDLPRISFPADQFIGSGWENTVVKFDWIAITDDPNFTPKPSDQAQSKTKDWWQFE